MNRLSLTHLLVLVVAAALMLTGCQAAQPRTMYHCPMHPNYVSDRPGECPFCGMKLVPIEKGTTPTRPAAQPPAAPAPSAGAPPAAPAKVLYTCPMHPQVQSDKPGQCPICGMDLVKKTVSSKTGQYVAGPQQGTAAAPQAGIPIHDYDYSSQLAGIRTVAATTGTLTGTLLTSGTVVMPETGVRQVTTKVAGWVEKLYVNSVGRLVRAGEPLFELYSPELLASQEEYVKARETAGQFAKSSLPEVQRGGQDLAAAARRRLELYDVPPEFIERLEQTGTPQRTITFRAPFGGYVTEKAVVEGQRVEPGMNLITLADLSQAWVTAQVFEAEAAAARPGRAALVTLPYDPSVKLRGRLDLVYPTLDAETRSLKVRLRFANPNLVLKPGMFVTVEIESQRAHGVVVPDTALVDTGTRQVVFVQTGPGRFEPRDVQAGLRSDGQVVLRSGLKAGEQVAAAANFLLDSESRLRSAMGAVK
ncbi:MAG: efflux RND transporter periplasmic adaptor subunit [Bacteroidales bacterium]